MLMCARGKVRGEECGVKRNERASSGDKRWKLGGSEGCRYRGVDEGGGAEKKGKVIGMCRRDGERERGWLWKVVVIRGQ